VTTISINAVKQLIQLRFILQGHDFKKASAKNDEYLQRLEDKNRMKKLFSTKSVKEKQIEDREKGILQKK
jgi:hypothetical protein